MHPNVKVLVSGRGETKVGEEDGIEQTCVKTGTIGALSTCGQEKSEGFQSEVECSPSMSQNHGKSSVARDLSGSVLTPGPVQDP